jgi:hypothetical protein
MRTDSVREHNMIRFINGVPKYVWYSQHANGEAFEFDILNKDGSGKRVSFHFLTYDRLSYRSPSHPFCVPKNGHQRYSTTDILPKSQSPTQQTVPTPSTPPPERTTTRSQTSTSPSPSFSSTKQTTVRSMTPFTHPTYTPTLLLPLPPPLLP